MSIQSDGTGGWFIHYQAGTSFHVTEDWLEDMTRHQKLDSPAWHRLRYAVRNGSTDADQIERDFREAYQGVGRSNRRRQPRGVSPEFAEFIKQQRGQRADR